MAQIQDYEVPDSPAAETVSGARPNVEEAGAIGRSVTMFGERLMQSQQAVERRQAQSESEDAFVTMSTNRTQFTKDLQDHVNDSDFDSQKFSDHFDEVMDKQREKYDTDHGIQSFNRQAARLKSTLLTTAAKVQSHNAGVKAVADMNTQLNQDAATLQMAPEQWEDLISNQDQIISDKVKANSKLAGQEPLLAQHAKSQIMMSALQGYIKQDPGSAENGEGGAGQRFLDSGVMDQYLSPQQRQQAQRMIDMGQRAHDVQGKLMDKAQDKRDNQEQQVLGNKFYDKIQAGSFSVKDIMNAKYDDGRDMDWQFKKQMIDLGKSYAENKVHGDANTELSLITRVNSDPTSPNHISDANDLRPYLGKGLSIPMYNTLQKQIAGAGMSQSDKASEKIFLSNMKAGIVKTSLTGNGKDPASLNKYQAAYMDYTKEKQDWVAQGKPISSFWDPKTQGSFAAKLQGGQYQTSMKEQMDQARQMFQDNVVKTAQTVDPESVRKQGESIQDFLKRRKGK